MAGPRSPISLAAADNGMGVMVLATIDSALWTNCAGIDCGGAHFACGRTILCFSHAVHFVAGADLAADAPRRVETLVDVGSGRRRLAPAVAADSPARLECMCAPRCALLLTRARCSWHRLTCPSASRTMCRLRCIFRPSPPTSISPRRTFTLPGRTSSLPVPISPPPGGTFPRERRLRTTVSRRRDAVSRHHMNACRARLGSRAGRRVAGA
jgi:hypothetical protein